MLSNSLVKTWNPALGVFGKLQKVAISFDVSVRLSVPPQGTNQLPLYRLSWNLIFQYFSQICWENSSYIKMWQDCNYMKTNIHFWSFIFHFFIEWEMFQTKVVEKIKTHILCSILFFFFNCAVYEITWKNPVEPGRPQMTYGACSLHAGYLCLQTHTQNM